MDYKEKYEMGLEGIQEILGSGEDSIKMSRLKLRLQGIFPEIKESEDERIRKEIIAILKYKYEHFSKDPKYSNAPQWIAWLNKQGEQKPAEKVEPKTATWKPSDAQMKALKEACDEHWEPDGLDPLYTLYQDLKKLMEE